MLSTMHFCSSAKYANGIRCSADRRRKALSKSMKMTENCSK